MSSSFTASAAGHARCVLEWALDQEGYRVINLGYPFTKAGIAELADLAVSGAVARCGAAPRIHFVAHSLGGILLRHWIARHPPVDAGRVVMLGPPNGGSGLVDAFRNWETFQLLRGPAGSELCTRPDAGPHHLPCTAPLEAGIIAGTRSLNPLTSAFIAGPNDGKVSVASAFAMPAAAKLTLPVSHTWMMMNRNVVEVANPFLRTGSFVSSVRAAPSAGAGRAS